MKLKIIKINCDGEYCGSCKWQHRDPQNIKRCWCDIFHDSISEQLEYFKMDTTGNWLRDPACIVAEKEALCQMIKK